MSRLPSDDREWLEADGLGGFASGTPTGERTRRYHALLAPATTPPTGRVALVNGLEVWVVSPAGREALSSQRYAPDVVHPDGAERIFRFTAEPWPTWTYRLADGTEIVHEVFAPHGRAAVVCSWRLRGRRAGLRLMVRPLVSGRDIHALHQENAAFAFGAARHGDRVTWRPYDGVPAIAAITNGTYAEDPQWYRRFLYAEERARGFEHTEDLASPGTFVFDLSAGEAVLVLAAGLPDGAATFQGEARATLDRLRTDERTRRAGFPSPLHRAADAYLVRRGSGLTIIAGYPWFTDWGRDTFVSVRGLCLAAGRLDEARSILLAWADTVSEGMLPNRFIEQGDAPEFNSVDAALWYVVAVGELIDQWAAAGRPLPAGDRTTLVAAVEQILAGYRRGTRHRIRADADGLLAAGAPGQQLTWMDAKVGDWVVTPRSGKPVEVQALWINALAVGALLGSDEWRLLAERARAAFTERFWNPAGWLYDVVDVEHRAGTVDPAFRPNQILAIGGLPLPVLEGERARQVVDAVEARLWTPLGLRSLAPDDPAYRPRYEGGPVERDGSYHQGTVWPWLLGPFVDAWVRVRGGTMDARDTARRRFLDPLMAHLAEAGIGHVSEIADADPPHRPRGCPFQAWSVGEVLRLTERVLVGEAELAAR
jgi:predicted glycogen debranching enzyme